DLGVSINTPGPFFWNNKAALHITTNLAFHKCTKHLKIDCHIVMDKYKVIQSTYLVSKQQLADLRSLFLVLHFYTYVPSWAWLL
ncbi:UNVERIFIED_CONTAM: hypothetical protein Sradi_0867500, partial [Sesamum radiatum]